MKQTYKTVNPFDYGIMIDDMLLLLELRGV